MSKTVLYQAIQFSIQEKVKGPSLAWYLLIAGGRISWIRTITKRISTMWNANHLVQDLNSGRRVHFLWRVHIWENRSQSDGMKMYRYEKTCDIQNMILFIVESFADDKRFGFLNIKTSSGRLIM